MEQAWRIVEPVLGMNEAVHSHAPGTWGPPEADRIGPVAAWHNPVAASTE